MEKLNHIKDAIWYGYLSGHYTYGFACDIYVVLLVSKNELLKEEKS